MTAEEILDTLALRQDSLGWLANDGRQHLGDARLTVFRSEEHFVVFAEFPHFFYGGGDFTNWLNAVGNCLAPHAHEANFSKWGLIEQVSAPHEDGTKEYLDWREHPIRRNAFSVLVGGQKLDFQPNPQDYFRSGIVFFNGANRLSPGQLLRFLSVTLNHPFFSSEDELRALIDPAIAPEMSLFLQTSWWQHPVYLLMCDASVDDDPEFASSMIKNIPCWQILARAIASGDLSEWNAQDTSGFNTDWERLEHIYQENNSGYGFE